MIYFTSFYCVGRYAPNKLASLPMCRFTAQLVEHRTGITEVTGLNPVEALIFMPITSAVKFVFLSERGTPVCSWPSSKLALERFIIQ